MKALTVALIAMAGPVFGQVIEDCAWQASAESIVEPWEENSRTFANGDVRLAVLDTIEPAAGALHLLVLSPPYDELGGRQCKVISREQGIGWVQLEFAALTAGYDPAVGLTFTLPGRLYDPAFGYSNSVELYMTLNQATGAIQVEQAFGDEKP